MNDYCEAESSALHELTVYLAGADKDDGPLHRFLTAEPIPVPQLGEPLDTSAWPAPRLPLCLALGEGLTVVGIEENIFTNRGVSGTDRTITVARGPDGMNLDLVEALSEAARQRRRADFLASMVDGLAPDITEHAIGQCVASIVDGLKMRPAHGFDDFGPSAWHEAAGILQADAHLMADQVLHDLAGAASVALRELPMSVRIAAWSHITGGALSANSDLWDRRSLDDFDPATAWSGCNDEVEQHVAGRAESTLRNADIRASAD